MFARLLAFFIIVPLIELALFIEIGTRIGLVATVATIILTAMIGASLTRFQGLKTLQRYQEAIAAGRLPHEEVMDGIMILVAAAVLVTPGFFTDAFGFLLLVPPVRGYIRRRVGQTIAERIRVAEVDAGRGFDGSEGPEGEPRSHRGERIIDAEVIDVTVERD